MARTVGRGRRPRIDVDREKVKWDYLDKALTVAEVQARNGAIDKAQMYRILDKAGVPRRDSPEFDHYVLSQGDRKSA